MLIDLSNPITESMPVYPGDPATKVEQTNIIQTKGFEDHYLSFGSHAGTHIDAPSHMILNGNTLDQMQLESFTGRGVLVKVMNKRFDLHAISAMDIREGDVVLFYTGMSERYTAPDYFEDYPALPKDLAEYLVQKKVKMVGVDTCSVDTHEFTTHKILLGQNILILENLTNLVALENKQFTIYAFPLNLQIDGSPVRVVAEIKETNI